MKRELARFARVAAMAFTGFVGPAFALESSTVGSLTNQANVNVLNIKIDTVVAALQAQLQGMLSCSAQSKFYAPGTLGADSNGCVSAANPIVSNSIVAFNGTICPSGWSEYTAARGRFLRGVDNGAGLDPDGTRAPGALQGDMVGPHWHYFSVYDAAWGIIFDNFGYGSSYGGAGSPQTGATSGTYEPDNSSGLETRPKNVAVLFCKKN